MPRELSSFPPARTLTSKRNWRFAKAHRFAFHRLLGGASASHKEVDTHALGAFQKHVVRSCHVDKLLIKAMGTNGQIRKQQNVLGRFNFARTADRPTRAKLVVILYPLPPHPEFRT